MSVSRPHARRFQLGLIALLLIAGQSLGESGEQWRPAGVTRPANLTTRPNADAWRLPNEQQSLDSQQSDDEDANPLRKKDKQAKSEPGEPRAFQPETGAKNIAANDSAAQSSAKKAVQKQSPSAAVVRQPMPAAPVKVAQSQPQPRNVQFQRSTAMQQPSYQRRPTTAGQSNNVRRANVDVTDTMWDTVNVAFQSTTSGSSTSKATSESLPAPSGTRIPANEPVMRHIDSPNYIEPYAPPCECGPDGCCDDAGMWDGGFCQPGCGAPCCGEPCCGAEPGSACEPGCGCDDCKKDLFCIGPGDDESCHTVRLRWPKWQEVTVFAGAQGFKGPYDQARDSGNFGFNEGFNIGAKIPYCALGYQFGYRGVQSQLNGDKDTGATDSVIQHFVTVGVFHRQAEGLQFGVVWDGLSDERGDSQQFNQVRSEISIINCQHEFGFTGIFGSSSNTLQASSFQASDQYLFFYRLHGNNGGEGRVFAGVNGDSDGIVGSDMLLPLGDRFLVSSGFTYLIPNEADGTLGATNEAWNISVGLVWSWDRQARKSFNNCYRPMFNVADNGTFIIDRNN